MSKINTKGAALITGASTGIGAVYADRLAKRGHDLILVARDEARLNALAERLRAEAGVKVEVIKADLTNKADLEQVERRLASDAAITMLVNNAGVAGATDFVGSDPDAFDKMILERPCDIFADRPADDRLARAVHRLAITADEIMPVGQRFALGAQAIGAALRQPLEVVDLCLGQCQAVGNMAAAVLVIAAARSGKVEQAARDIGGIDAARILILQLVQAAFAAAVAQSLPLPGVEAGERRFPKGALRCRPCRHHFTHFASSAATLPGAPSSTSVEGSSSGSSASGLPSGSIKKASWLCAIR